MVVGRVNFLGPADGLRERELKEQLAKFANNDFRFKALYLARIQYQSESNAVMALCVVTIYGAQNAELTEQLKDIYAPLFPKGQYMDIIYLDDEEQEDRLAKVCPPFYNKRDRDANFYRDGLPLTGTLCPHCASGQSPISHAERVASGVKGDSGWRFYCRCGQPNDAAQTLPLKDIIKLEPSLRNWLEMPGRVNLQRSRGKSRWEPIKEEGRNGHNGNGHNGHHENGANGNGNGNGHHSHGHSDAMYLRDTDQPFGKFTVNGNAEQNGKWKMEDGKNNYYENGTNGSGHLAEDDDPIRLYLPLLPGRIHPVEIALYYECLGCGVILSSAAPGDTKCRCGNIAISSGQVTIKDLAQAHAFRQT